MRVLVAALLLLPALARADRVVDLVGHTTHACVLMESGRVGCWGGNHAGQRGSARAGEPLNWLADDAIEVWAGSGRTCWQTKRGETRCLGNPPSEGDPNPLGMALGAALAPAGWQRVILLDEGATCGWTDRDEVLCWGTNREGILADGAVDDARPTEVPGVSDVVELALLSATTCARKRSGEVVCWGGYTVTDSLPHPTPLEKVKRLRGTNVRATALHEDGTTSLLVENVMGDDCPDDARCLRGSKYIRVRMKPDPGVVDDAASDVTGNFCVVRGGELRCLFDMGETNGWWHDRFVPIAGTKGASRIVVARDVICVELPGHALGCLWDHRFDNDEDFPQVAPTPRARRVPGLPAPRSAATTLDGICVETVIGEIRCFHEKDKATRLPAKLQGMRGLAGAGHFVTTCGLRAGKVVCWGQRMIGLVEVPIPVPVTQVEVGGSHACALTAAGKVWCWGDDRRGQLGRGRLLASPTPIRIEIAP
jgi:hypothetical protein